MAAEPKLWACAADVANRQTRRAYTLIFFIIINYYFKFRKLPLRYPNYLHSPEADFKVDTIFILLLREGGVPVGGGGRWIHNSVIYNKIGIHIIFPITSVFDHSSFPKEEI